MRLAGWRPVTPVAQPVWNWRLQTAAIGCALVLALMLAPAGCKRTSIKWDPALTRWFAHSAGQPTDLPHSYWGPEEHELFLRRAGHADVAALGTVRMVRRHDHLGRPLHIAYAFRPARVFHGDLETRLDEDNELILTLDHTSPDFRLALRAEEELPSKRFLLLLKERPTKREKRPAFGGWRASLWRPPPAGNKTYLWSFYRPEDELLSLVEVLYKHQREHAE